MKNYSNNITGIMNCVKDCVQQAYNKGYKQAVDDYQNSTEFIEKIYTHDIVIYDENYIFYKGKKFISQDLYNKAKNGDAILLLQSLLDKIEQVENEPTGARYWVGTQELKNILVRYLK